MGPRLLRGARLRQTGRRWKRVGDNSSTQTLAQHRMHLISVITPCFNEAENVRELYTRVRRAFEALPRTVMSTFSSTTPLRTKRRPS